MFRRFAVVAAVAAAGVLAACSVPDAASTTGGGDGTWTFSVDTTGPGIGSVTYMKPGFQTAQDTSPKGKHWEATIKGKYDVKPNMNAQASGDGEISCKVTKDGKTVAENKSVGKYSVVTC